MNMKRSTIGLVAALLLAAVGGFLLFTSGGDDASDASEAQAETAPVLVAVDNIPSRTTASEMAEQAWKYVDIQEVELSQITPGAFSSIENLEDLALGGNIVVTDISSGTQLTIDNFIVPGEQSTSALPTVDATLFEITVALESQRAMGGDIFPGQEVAVLASFDGAEGFEGGSRVVLDSIQITNVETETLLTQEQLSNDPLAPTLATTGRIFVTFGVDVAGAEKLTYANEFGRIWLARQNSEASAEDSELRTLDNTIANPR